MAAKPPFFASNWNSSSAMSAFHFQRVIDIRLELSTFGTCCLCLTFCTMYFQIPMELPISFLVIISMAILPTPLLMSELDTVVPTSTNKT